MQADLADGEVLRVIVAERIIYNILEIKGLDFALAFPFDFSSVFPIFFGLWSHGPQVVAVANEAHPSPKSRRKVVPDLLSDVFLPWLPKLLFSSSYLFSKPRQKVAPGA